MIRPSSALTRYGILAAVLLLALLGLQRVVSFRRELVREGDRLKSPPDAVGESVDTERPPEPRLVADALHPAAPHPSSSASRRPDSAAKSSSDSSSPSQSVARSYPWQRTLAQLGDPVDGRRLCFTPLKTAPGGDPVAWLSDWFEDLGGETPSLVSIDQTRDRQVALRGWVRLRPPLRRDVTLRLGLAELDALVIHAWSGLAGASLVYRGDGRAGWEGYRTERSAVQIEPTSRQLVTRDDGRWLRREMSSGQPIELRYREGQLVLSCGQTVLLSVPLAREPAEVYVTGATVVRGIGFQRSRGFPLPDRAPANRRSLAIDTLGWTGGRVAKTAVNDIVTLTAKGGESVWATVPALGLREVVVELSEARYGVGVFLGDRRGTPRCVVRLLPGATETEPALFTSTAVAPPPAPRGLEAVRGGPYWVRLVVGCGLVRGWVSRDGFRWLELDTVLRVQRAELASVGFLVPDRGPQSRIQLRRLHVGRLPALGALAALERASQAVSCADAATWKDWERRVEEARPATVSADVWNAGCAFSTLQADSTIPYAARLMDDVLDQATRWVPQVPDRLRMFEAVSELVDLRETHRLEAMVARFHRLADDWARERGGEAYAQVRATLLTLPLDTDISFQATRFTAVRRELVHALVAGDSQSTLDLCQRARFDQTADAPGEHSWIAWAGATARRQLPGAVDGGMAGRFPRDWEHPWVVDVDRETYNALAELNALVSEGSLEDASSWLTGLDVANLRGLVPDRVDNRRWVSLPLALQLLHRRSPALARVLHERHGDLIRLRLEEAITANQPATVRRVSNQFPGTPGAVAGYRWLGDRALIDGRFVAARSAYRRALADAVDTDRPRLVACLRLAQALLGSPTGTPLTTSVRLGEWEVDPQAWEQLMKELAGRVALPSDRRAPISVDQKLTTGSRLVTVGRGRFDGPVGDSPSQQVTPDVTRLRVPWVDRQLAVIREGETLYASNRFQVAAYDLSSGRRLWRNESLPDKRAFRARDWSLTPMRPCLTKNRLFARLLYRPSPLLVCLDKTDGSLLWKRESPRDEWFVSDPVMKQRELWILQIRPAGPHQLDVRLLVIDPHTGGLLRQMTLIRVRDLWKNRRYCAVADLPDGLAASLSGVTLRLDSRGAIRWVRRHLMVPVDLETGWVQQVFQPPLTTGDRLFLTQPGAAALECVDLASGRLHWRSVEPGLRRWIGLTDDGVIYQTKEGIGSWSRENGALIWHRRGGAWLSAACLEGDHLLVASRQQVPGQPNWYHPTLTCYQASTGRPLAVWPLAELADPDPRMGPLVMARQGLWAFFGRGTNDPFRDLVELRRRTSERPPQPQESDRHEE